MEPPAHSKKSWTGRGIMAMGLSMLIPGLGQTAAGRGRRGLKWFIASLCTTGTVFAAAVWPVMVPVAVVAFVIGELIWFAAWIDAFGVGARSDRPMLGLRRTRFLVGILTAVVGWLGLLYLPLALCTRQYLCEAFVIPTASMQPTLLISDRFLAHKFVAVGRWSIVVFHPPVASKEVWAKRVVGLPGETVEITDGVLRINGRPLDLPPQIGRLIAPSLPAINATKDHPLTLKSDEYFVVGDNSRRSYDSRFWPTASAGHQPGAVPKDSIIGVATYIYWPLERWKNLR